jgi:predicted transposase YdaD
MQGFCQFFCLVFATFLNVEHPLFYLSETTSYPKDYRFRWISRMKTTFKISEQLSHIVLTVIPSIHSLLIFLQL